MTASRSSLSSEPSGALSSGGEGCEGEDCKSTCSTSQEGSSAEAGEDSAAFDTPPTGVNSPGWSGDGQRAQSETTDRVPDDKDAFKEDHR